MVPSHTQQAVSDTAISLPAGSQRVSTPYSKKVLQAMAEQEFLCGVPYSTDEPPRPITILTHICASRHGSC